MDAKKQLEAELVANGFVLVRHSTHPVYKNAEGLTVTLPFTPSDHRSWKNTLHQFRRMMRKSKQPELIPTPKPTPTPEPQESKREIRERNIGMTPERWLRQFKQPQLELTEVEQPRVRKEELIDMYAVGACMRRAFAILLEDYMIEPEEFYKRMTKNMENAPTWEQLDRERARNLEEKIAEHNENNTRVVPAATRIFQAVVQRIRHGERVKTGRIREDLVKAFVKIFRADPMLLVGNHVESYSLLLANTFIEERKFIFAITWATKVEWTKDGLNVWRSTHDQPL